MLEDQPKLNRKLLEAFDGHAVDDVRTALEAGADARTPIDGKTPLIWLLEQYVRSDRLKVCIQLLLDHGATCDDPFLLPVVMDDDRAIHRLAVGHPGIASHRVQLVSTFTPLQNASLLHVAAEYGCLKSAEALLEVGLDVNVPAELDAFGLNGHTPLFHTVHSNANRSEPVMRLLLAAGADAQYRVFGLTWGQGFPWETVFMDITPISYAQLGLLPQVHRDERDIYSNVRALVHSTGAVCPPWLNIPNRYLAED